MNLNLMLKESKHRKLFLVSVISATLSLFPNLGNAQVPHITGEQEIQHTDNHTPDNHAEDSHNQTNEAEFDPGEWVIDHIKDSHDWHLWTKAQGQHVSIPLPIIIYSKEKGLNAFLSTKLAHGHHHNGFYIEEGKILEELENHEVVSPIDLSITKNVTGMMFSAIIILILFIRMGRIYNKNESLVPSGLNGFLEPMILFIRNDVAIPNIGEEKYEKFMPYLLTVFFFIFINNLMGLVPAVMPFGANITGNISITLTLAFITMVITNINGSKNYWLHIFNTPGVPWWLKFPIPLMPVVEFIGVIAKPFALMIRLFANITAGHIIILSLVSLIFIFKSIAIAPLSIAFVLFMYCVELLVAFLQAYVFTLLSALFIGLAAKEQHH